MTNQEWIELFQQIPVDEHPKMVIVFESNAEISVDTIVRLEPNFAVVRGRVGGNVEEARGFFVPYQKLLCLRLERIMKVDELDAMFGAAAVPKPQVKVDTRTPINLGAAPTDAASASRLLIERLRANRQSQSPAPAPATRPGSITSGD